MVASGDFHAAQRGIDVWIVEHSGSAQDAGRAGSVLAHQTLKRLVTSRAHVPEDSFEVLHAANGEPIIRGVANLCVSVAHTAGAVACAVSDHRVGVDIERVDRKEIDEAFVARICAQGELRLVEQCDARSARAEVVRLWARKEAVAKATGVGLRYRFDLVDVSRDVPSFGGRRSTSHWVLDLVGGPPEFAVALAGVGRRGRVRATAFGAATETSLRLGSR